MNKLEYLRTLENTLQTRLPRQEVNDIIRDYAEYFAEGARQGKTDDEIAANLGDPIEVARQVLAESQPAAPRAVSEKKEKSVWVKVLLILVGICLLPLIGSVLFGLLCAVAASIACLFGAVALGGCGVLLGLALLVVSLMYVGTLPVTAVVLACLVGIGLVSLSVLGLCLSIIVIRLIWKAACWCGRKLYTAITKKPWAEAPVQTPETGWQPQPEEPCVQPAAEEEVAE